jgi:glutathione S-transferase
MAHEDKVTSQAKRVSGNIDPVRNVKQATVPSVIKLYTNPKTRAIMIDWYLQELGLQYDAVQIDFDNKEHKGEAYLKIHPLGQLPALEDGEFKLVRAPCAGACYGMGLAAVQFSGTLTVADTLHLNNKRESGAILLYLADKYGGVVNPQERGLLAQWTLFANSSLSDAVFVDKDKKMKPVLDMLNTHLASSEYLLGPEFTEADVPVGSYLLYLPMFDPDVDLSPWPAVQAYMKRLSDRPAYQSACGTGAA